MLVAVAIVVLAAEAAYLASIGAASLIRDLNDPAMSNYGGDLFFIGVALAAVPVAYGVWRRRRLAWIVLVPYEMFALVLFAGQSLN